MMKILKRESDDTNETVKLDLVTLQKKLFQQV